MGHVGPLECPLPAQHGHCFEVVDPLSPTVEQLDSKSGDLVSDQSSGPQRERNGERYFL